MAFFTLIATCVVMFLAAMGAGMVPLQHATLLPSLASGIGSPASSMMMASSSSSIGAQDNLAVVSAVGAGLLISTALAVVVPEGFHLLSAIERKAAVKLVVAEEEEEEGHEGHGGGHEHERRHEGSHAHAHAHGEHSHDAPHSHASDPVPHWLPGFALASGFFFMMALDALSAAPHGACGGGRSGSSATTIATQGGGGVSAPATAPPPTSSAAASGALRALIVHAAADGLAVGASCAATASATGAGAQTLAWSVAAAMALHKAPAAFGLSATLASAQWGRQRAERGLLFFSLSSPLAALVTFLALVIFGGGDGTGLGVAAALLFSGGTLVHAAAVHVLPSVASKLNSNSSSSSSSSSSPDSSASDDEASMRVRYALIAGAAAPLLLSAMAPHEH